MRLVTTFLIIILFNSCSKIEEEDLNGYWLIDEMFYKGGAIRPSSSKVLKFTPVGYGEHEVVYFASSNHKCDLPGINSNDIQLRWQIDNGKIVLYFDSSLLLNNILEPIEKFKPLKQFYEPNPEDIKRYTNDSANYKRMRDSILFSAEIKAIRDAINIYAGHYTIELKNEEALIIKSSTTQIHLLNQSYIMTKNLREMFQHLR